MLQRLQKHRAHLPDPLHRGDAGQAHSHGLFLNRGAYLHDAWNWLDFVVVVTGVLDITGVVASASFLKLFRILRPLRAINRIRQLKMLVRTVFASMPQLCRVTAVLIMFVLTFFGIIGLYMFKGHLRHGCFYHDGDGWVATGDVCDAECDWDDRMQLKGPCASLGNPGRAARGGAHLDSGACARQAGRTRRIAPYLTTQTPGSTTLTTSSGP